MRVAMYYNNNDVRLEEMDVPEIGPDELLMEVITSGLCGSDVMEWYRIKRAPLVLGHEVAGRVIETGKNVKKYQKGDPIVVSHHVPCYTCYYCLTGHDTACDTLRSTNFDPGGFSEVVRLPAINVDRGVHIIPEEITFEDATFHEPLGCVIRGQRIAALTPGQSVLVIGSGMAGLLHVHLARSSGAAKILAVDPIPYRLEAAKKFGADMALQPGEDIGEALRQLNNGRLADLVIECSGKKDAILQGLASVERGGTVMLFAPTGPDVQIPFSVNDLFFRNDVTVTTSYGSSPYDSWLALELIRSSSVNVKQMITHRLPLAETQKGFQIVSKSGDSIKVIIEPQK
jgi:L-iditol 2-dehydrogenase